MQGLPKQTREPAEILGTDAEPTLEDLRRGYKVARARASQTGTLADAGQAASPDAPLRATLAEVEWAYRELLARAAVPKDDGENEAVSAVLLPGLGAETADSLSFTQNNVVHFTAHSAHPALARAATPVSRHTDCDEEDLAALPFATLETLAAGSASSQNAQTADEDPFDIPELREALAQAAAPVMAKAALGSVSQGPHVAPRAAVSSASSMPQAARAPSAAPVHTPGSRLSAYVAAQTTANANTTRPSDAPPGTPAPLTRTPHSAGATPAVRTSHIGKAINVTPARTIRTVIGGEERLVVNVVCKATHDETLPERLRALIESAPANGALLRALRLAADVSERELCQRIRIPLEQLAAIEEDAFDRLPAPVYYRGFVVSVLKYIGVERLELADLLTDNYRGQLRARYFRGPV